jgi:hypothetical protein
MRELPPDHVLVQFGSAIPSEVKGPALLLLEVYLRSEGCKAEVFLETMRDQNKARRNLTREDVI